MSLNPQKLNLLNNIPVLAQIFGIIGAKKQVSSKKISPLIVTYGNIMSGALGGAVSAGLSVVTGAALTQESESKNQPEELGENDLHEIGMKHNEVTLGGQEGKGEPKVPI